MAGALSHGRDERGDDADEPRDGASDGVSRPLTRWLAPEGRWPAGPFVGDAPAGVLAAAHTAAAVAALCSARAWTPSDLARASGADVQELTAVLDGKRAPSVHLLAQLQAFASDPLWPAPAQARAHPDRRDSSSSS